MPRRRVAQVPGIVLAKAALGKANPADDGLRDDAAGSATGGSGTIGEALFDVAQQPGCLRAVCVPYPRCSNVQLFQLLLHGIVQKTALPQCACSRSHAIEADAGMVAQQPQDGPMQLQDDGRSVRKGHPAQPCQQGQNPTGSPEPKWLRTKMIMMMMMLMMLLMMMMIYDVR